jgi:hypothetical protein
VFTKVFIYTALLFFLTVLYLVGNQVKNVIITSEVFFEIEAYLALVFSILVFWLYLKFTSKEKLENQFYRQPGWFVTAYIFRFILLLIILYVFLQPTIKILTKFTASKTYQDIFRYTVTEQTKVSAGLNLFHCDRLLINIKEMHENASFCLTPQVEAPEIQQIIDNQTNHQVRIKGSKSGYGIWVKSLELVPIIETEK